MKSIEDRLRLTIGLDAAAVGPNLIQNAVRQRMRRLGLKRTADYRRSLERSRAEWNELVEAVVVSETWFFRDPEPVTALARHIREERLPAHAGTPLRLLSVPCASGEEPYSLVMAFLDAGILADQFLVEGLDLSARALAHAARGVYGRNSFRGSDLAFRDRYFQPFEDGFRLDPAVRNCVRFWRGNLLGPAVLTNGTSYDFIFCRNLLIYLDRTMQARALSKLARLLSPSGILFVGPVEHPLAVQHGFTDAAIPMAFSCSRPAQVSRRQPSSSKGKPSDVASSLRRGGQSQTPPLDNQSTCHGTDLETARRLVEAGLPEEAVRICEAHLRQDRTAAHAYYLLGLAREAGGEPDAIECYRKALYLEPDHHECLLQMASLLQKHGDPARAGAFKSRAQRIELKT